MVINRKILTMRNFFLILIFCSNFSYSQNVKQLQKEIKKQFKESSNEYSLNSTWLICNRDSADYLSDTLKLYNHINYFYDPSNCCYFIKWEFENSREFRLIETHICNEPPTSKADINNFYKLTWKRDKDKLYIYIENKGKNIKEKFKILDYYEETLWNEIHNCMILKLLRI